MNWFMNRRIATKLVLTVSSVLASSLLIGVVSIDRLSLLNSKAEDLGTNELNGNPHGGGVRGSSNGSSTLGDALDARLWRRGGGGDGGERDQIEH